MSKLEQEAYELFSIVHGKGDAGSEFEFQAQKPAMKDGWLRLARYFRRQQIKATANGLTAFQLAPLINL